MPGRKRKQRIPLSRLGEPSKLPITPEQVLSLANEWASDFEWEEGWGDVKLLAKIFLFTPEDDPMAFRAWHHLLLSVGNFKRSTGPIIPCRLPRPTEPLMDERPDRIRIPGAVAEFSVVVSGDRSTWPHLTSIDGLAVPTATTLLAALWPQQHIIIDRRDLTAAVGLGAGTRWMLDNLNEAYLPRRDSHDRYWAVYAEWFRDTVLATAEDSVTPGQVERALYRLDRRTQRALPNGWKWSQYRAEAERQLIKLKT